MHSKFKVLLVGLLLFIPTFADSAVFPTQQTLCVGNSNGQRCFTDLTNLITLVASATSSSVSTFRKPNAASGYQVTAGKTLRIYALCGIPQGTSGSEIRMGYGDTDVGNHSGNSAPTNAVYIGGDSTNMMVMSSVTGVPSCIFPDFDVIATKYFFGSNQSGSTVTYLAYGYES